MSMLEKIKKILSSGMLLVILLLVVIFLFSILAKPKNPFLTVKFYDVGQGDAALISTPNGKNVLIDGGPNSSVVSKLDEDINFYNKRLDAVILSHPHADHLDGLLTVIDKYEVKSIYLTGVVHTTPEYISFLQKVKDKQIETHQVTAGSELDLGDGIRLINYFPLANMAGQEVDNLNNSSIVSKLVWGESKVLFTGDLEKEGQAELLATNPDLKADILKVPHHGSKDSANSDFIKAVSPKYAVISVGKDNKFGHPSSVHLNLLFGTTIYRTDEDGNITFHLTQKQIEAVKN